MVVHCEKQPWVLARICSTGKWPKYLLLSLHTHIYINISGQTGCRVCITSLLLCQVNDQIIRSYSLELHKPEVFTVKGSTHGLQVAFNGICTRHKITGVPLLIRLHGSAHLCGHRIPLLLAVISSVEQRGSISKVHLFARKPELLQKNDADP
jgi:hypothetical protein